MDIVKGVRSMTNNEIRKAKKFEGLTTYYINNPEYFIDNSDTKCDDECVAIDNEDFNKENN